MKRRAFTLIELLITAVLLVVVGGFAVVIFSSTVALTTEANRTTGAASQLKQALDVIEKTYVQSSPTEPVDVLTTIEPGTEGTVLVMSTRIPTSSGADSGVSERRFYCTASVGNGRYRLAQFSTAAVYAPGNSFVACDNASLSQLVGGSPVTGPIYLTDAQSSVTRFTAQHVEFTSSTPPIPSSAIRIEITSEFAGLSAESRADASGITRPLTARTTAVRNFQNGIQPFNGISTINGL